MFGIPHPSKDLTSHLLTPAETQGETPATGPWGKLTHAARAARAACSDMLKHAPRNQRNRQYHALETGPALTAPTQTFTAISSDSTVEVKDLMGETQQVLSDAKTITGTIIRTIKDKHYAHFSLEDVVTNALTIQVNSQLEGAEEYFIGTTIRNESTGNYNTLLTLKKNGIETERILELDGLGFQWREYIMYFQAGRDPNNASVESKVISFHPISNQDEIPKVPSDVFYGKFIKNTFLVNKKTFPFKGQHFHNRHEHYQPDPNQDPTSTFTYHQEGEIKIARDRSYLTKGTRTTVFFKTENGKQIGTLTEKGEFAPVSAGAPCAWGNSALHFPTQAELANGKGTKASQVFQFSEYYTNLNQELSKDPIEGPFTSHPNIPYPITIEQLGETLASLKKPTHPKKDVGAEH